MSAIDDYDEWNDSPMDNVMRFFLMLLIIGLTLACGVAIHGRIEVGDEVGKPQTDSPCPQEQP